jgi:hypothetical protein
MSLLPPPIHRSFLVLEVARNTSSRWQERRLGGGKRNVWEVARPTSWRWKEKRLGGGKTDVLWPSLAGARIALSNIIMELSVTVLAMKLQTIHMREKEITPSLNKIHINMRIMFMNSLLQDMMPSIIMIDHLHIDELISMRAPTKTLLEGEATLGKFIRKIHGNQSNRLLVVLSVCPRRH